MKADTVRTIGRLAKATLRAREDHRDAQEWIRKLQTELHTERERRDPQIVDTQRGRLLALIARLESHLGPLEQGVPERLLRQVIANMRATLGSVEGGE